MITIAADSSELSALDVDVIVVGVFKGGIDGPGATAVKSALAMADFPVTPGFRGDVGQTLRVSAPDAPFASVLLVGLGRMDAVTPAALRRAAGDASRALPKARRIATTLAQISPSRAAIEAVADGLILGAHADRRFKSADDDTIPDDRSGILLVPSSLLPEAEAAIQRSRVTCDAILLARDLVNTPPGHLTPDLLADAVAGAMPDSVTVEVHRQDWLSSHNCGGILGVGQGSAAPPCLVELTYEPPNPLAHVVLVGKGITFDTGGLNLKPAAGMIDMKSDMGGAAAVAGALAGIGRLGGRVKVTGLLAVAENAIGGDAQRPSDVIRTFDGTTVEVVHTDAEGRLVMADALGYGASMTPDAMIDIATLTGSAVEALGPYIAGLMSNDESLADDVDHAANDAGEAVWRLPLPSDLDHLLESDVADIDNLGRPRGAGALLAGLFLQRFVGDVPWVHLDIAGPAFLSKEDERGHQHEGGTGFGVATLVGFLQRGLQ